MPNVVVGVADYKVSKDPEAMLVTYALGSCVAVMLYDAAARVGGLAHILLPNSQTDLLKEPKNPAMYADTGIPLLFSEVQRLGADRKRLVGHLAGGAQILDPQGLFNIGGRNCVAARQLLWRIGVMIENESIGGNTMRSVGLHVATGQVWLKQQASIAATGSPERKGVYLGLPNSGGG